MTRMLDHLYIATTILLTVYSQLIMRWQVLQAGPLPGDLIGKFYFVGHLFLSPWVLSGVVATLLAGIAWMLAISRFEISYAYPWIGLNFVLTLVLGVLLFGETLNTTKIVGTVLVVVGIAIVAKE